METLLELFDRELLRNVLSAINFRPKRVIFLGSSDMEQKKEDIMTFFHRKEYDPETHFIYQDPSDFRGVLDALRDLYRQYPDLSIDITGGRNLALLSAGIFTASQQVPLLYFDWKRERYFNVRGFESLEGVPLSAKLSVEDVLTLFGCTYLGSAHLPRHIDVRAHRDKILRMWELYLRHQDRWSTYMSYFQSMGKANRLSDTPLSFDVPNRISLGNYAVSAPRRLLRDLEQAGILTHLEFTGHRVRMRFTDEIFRNWMSIAGIWLELYLYLRCLDSGHFDDVQMSVRADWDHDPHAGTTNELDVVATRGVFTTFFSCKIGSPKTSTIEEIAVLSRRFGGRMARAVVVTATNPQKEYPAVCQRAEDMGISLITLSDLTSDRLSDLLNQF